MNLRELWSAVRRAFDADDPETVERTALALRVALGCAAVAQYLDPTLVPPLFSAAIATPRIGHRSAVGSALAHVPGIVPWLLLAAMMLAHARLLRRASTFAVDDRQVLWSTLLPGYNVPGTLRVFDETGRALRALGAPASTIQRLRWATWAATALAVALPLQVVAALAPGLRTLADVLALLPLGFLLLAARLAVLVLLHSAFTCEAVREALIAEDAPIAPPIPTSASLPTPPSTPTPTSRRTPSPSPTSASSPSPPRTPIPTPPRTPSPTPPRTPSPTPPRTPTPPPVRTAARPARQTAPATSLRIGLAGVGAVAAVLAVALYVRSATERRARAIEAIVDPPLGLDPRTGDIVKSPPPYAERVPSPGPAAAAEANAGAGGSTPAAAAPAPGAAAPAAPAAAAPAPPAADPSSLYGGRTASWWEERIAMLRGRSSDEDRRLADLTVARARANGLVVDESGARFRVTAPAPAPAAAPPPAPLAQGGRP